MLGEGDFVQWASFGYVQLIRQAQIGSFDRWTLRSFRQQILRSQSLFDGTEVLPQNFSGEMVCNTLCQTCGQPTEFCEAPPSCTHTSQPGKSAKDDQVAADNSDKSPELDTSLLAWLTFPPRYIWKKRKRVSVRSLGTEARPHGSHLQRHIPRHTWP